MKPINVGLLGFGTVGAGVAKILINNKDLITDRVGTEINLARIGDIDLTTDRGVTLAPGTITDDSLSIINDPNIDIIVETIGGTTIAKTFMEAALNAGKHVVTANKALLATHGAELFALAREKGVGLYYEASVGGCMPVIKTIRESLVGNHINSIMGILNGTCNYILTKIENEGRSFDDVLKEAQKMGYAEANPTLDIDGFDTAHKLAILTAISFGVKIDLASLYVEGIRNITPLDIEHAKEFGYKIKLLAIAKMHDGKIEARVQPTMIPRDSMLANVSGTLNAVNINGDAVGDVLLYGHGAGMMPTGSAIVSDIVDITRNILQGGQMRLPGLSFTHTAAKSTPIMPVEEVETHYYFRFSVKDCPNVLATIAGILGQNNISIRSVQQQGKNDDGSVPVVMLSHKAQEANVLKALSAINALDVVQQPSVLIRIEDFQ